MSVIMIAKTGQKTSIILKLVEENCTCLFRKAQHHLMRHTVVLLHFNEYDIPMVLNGGELQEQPWKLLPLAEPLPRHCSILLVCHRNWRSFFLSVWGFGA